MNAIADPSCHVGDLPRVDEILSLLLPRLAPVGTVETVPLREAMGRILAGDVFATLDAPACDRSAMDGYAFRFGDTGPLRLVGSTLAGRLYASVVRRDECVAIATGGAVPTYCDTVAMREHCEITPDGVLVSAKACGANIRRRGEDFRTGDVLLQSGVRIGARQMGLLAAAGVEVVAVCRRLRIALISMGDELVEAAPDGIRDANKPMLHALCAGNGFGVTDLGILPDSRAALAEVLAHAAAAHDVVVTTAGTSMGDEDHARGAVLESGGQLLIAGAVIKPGKPVSFAEIGRTLVIALPGNPAAAYVTFLILGLPLLRRLSGRLAAPMRWQTVRAGFRHSKKSGFREYLRVRLTGQDDGTLCAERCSGDGSAMLASLAAADGLVTLAEDDCDIREGDMVSFASFEALESA